MKRKILKYVLLATGVYVLYIIAGLALLQMGKVKEWVVFPNVAIRDSDHDRDDSKAGTDGPHIFYNDSFIVAATVVMKDTVAVGVMDTFGYEQKKEITVRCTFPDHPVWDFTTRLKDNHINEPVSYPEPDSLIAISDIEGEFAAFRKLLIANHVMDAGSNWTFGTGHLALVGDFFDRGLNVTEVLWLIYHLEQQAATAGGKVHFVLGNHDIMNMSGDLRYLRNKYVANTSLIGADYKTWYTRNTELGRWLHSKNIIERVGNLLLAHAGISEEVTALNMDLQQMNDAARQHYSTDDSLRHASFKEGPLKILFHHKSSPFWYRGMVNRTAGNKEVDAALKKFAVKHIVLGHTKVSKVRTRYDGKIIAVDTRHAAGESQGMYYSRDHFYVVDTTGARTPLL